MRRWHLTIGIGTAAIGAAIVAPKLTGEAPEVRDFPEPLDPVPQIEPPADRDPPRAHHPRLPRSRRRRIRQRAGPFDRGKLPRGYADRSGDCDDGSSAIHPGAVDIPGDRIDQDCDGIDATQRRTTETDALIPELAAPVVEGTADPEPEVDWDNVVVACGMG